MRVENTTNSGLVTDVRHLKGGELRKMQQRARQKGFHPMTYALEKCVSVTEPGIYKDESDFGRLLSGDRILLYHKVREATKKTSVFKFTVDCPVKGCGRPIDWTIDLHTLEIKKLPDEHVKQLNVKNEFTEQLDGYGEVKVKYSDGYDEMRLLDNMGKYDSITAMILGQVICVGEHSGEKAILRLMDEESADLMDKLLGICRRYEFGPETSIEIECTNPRCMTVSTVPMPSDLRFFFETIGQSF